MERIHAEALREAAALRDRTRQSLVFSQEPAPQRRPSRTPRSAIFNAPQPAPRLVAETAVDEETMRLNAQSRDEANLYKQRTAVSSIFQPGQPSPARPHRRLASEILFQMAAASPPKPAVSDRVAARACSVAGQAAARASFGNDIFGMTGTVSVPHGRAHVVHPKDTLTLEHPKPTSSRTAEQQVQDQAALQTYREAAEAARNATARKGTLSIAWDASAPETGRPKTAPRPRESARYGFDTEARVANDNATAARIASQQRGLGGSGNILSWE